MTANSAQLLVDALQQVIDAGQPAHAARARELVDELTAAIASGDVRTELAGAARELLDSYLHDPYLTRNS